MSEWLNVITGDAPKETFIVLAPTGAGKTIVISAMDKGFFGERRFTNEVTEVYTSDWLRGQADRLRIDRLPPERTPQGGVNPERMVFLWERPAYALEGTAGEDLLLNRETNRQHVRDLIGDSIPIVVVNPMTVYRVAQHSVRALAFWCQKELGHDAEEALHLSLKIHFGIRAEELEKLLVGYAKVRPLLAAARWEFDPLKEAPEERYPLAGVNQGTDTRRFNTVLNDIISTMTRKSERANSLLRQTLPDVEQVILTFSHLDLLTYLPGVQLDLLGLAHSIVPPRPGVLVVSGRYVQYRLRRGEDRVEFYDDFSTEGPERLWEAMKSVIRARRQRRGRGGLAKAAPFVAVLLPLLVLAFVLLGAFKGLLLTVGAAALLVGWAACAYVGFRRLSSMSARRPTAPPAPAAPPRRSVAVPEALSNRAAPVETNHAAG